METAEQLLENLNRQFRAGEPAAVLLRTIDALEAAIRRHPPSPRPAQEDAMSEPHPPSTPDHPVESQPSMEEDEPFIIQVLEVDEEEVEEELRAIREAAEQRELQQSRLRPDPIHQTDEEFVLPTPHIPILRTEIASPSDPTIRKTDPEAAKQTPSFRSAEEQPRPKDLNESISEGGTSLNDRLRPGPDKSERLRYLEPIADLRKAIGINDRFRFVNELFDGQPETFSQALEQINSMENADQAFACLQNILGPSGKWNPEDVILHDLLQLVERRYL